MVYRQTQTQTNPPVSLYPPIPGLCLSISLFLPLFPYILSILFHFKPGVLHHANRLGVRPMFSSSSVLFSLNISLFCSISYALFQFKPGVLHPADGRGSDLCLCFILECLLPYLANSQVKQYIFNPNSGKNRIRIRQSNLKIYFNYVCMTIYA